MWAALSDSITVKNRLSMAFAQAVASEYRRCFGERLLRLIS